MKLTQNFPTSRIQYIDALKGVAILCICMLHFEDGVFPHWINVWVGCFMITAFYFTSGWVYALKSQKWDAQKTFKKRLRQLGTPYLWFSGLLLVVTGIWVAIGHLPPIALPKELFKTICLRGIGTLWFIPALGFGEVLFCILMSAKRKYHLPLLILMLTISVLADNQYSSYVYTFDFRNKHPIINAIIYPYICILTAWPIIYLGYWCSRLVSCHLPVNGNGRHRIIVGFIGIILIALSIVCINYPPAPFWQINRLLYTILPSLGLIGIFYALEGSILTSFFSYWGVNSLVLMCTHYTITLELCKIFDSIVLGNDDFSGVRTLIYFAICILATYPMVLFFNKKAPFFLGKGEKPWKKRVTQL